MTDHRELDQDLVELALGEVPEPRRSELLGHLTGCPRCRLAYGEVVGAIDATVPVAPQASPPAGFDARVLTAMGIDTGGGSVRPLERVRSPRMLIAAAAAALVLAAGVWAGTGALDDEVPEARGPVGASALATGDGEQVGTAAVAWMHDRRVLVVSISDAPVGVAYTCRVRLAEGGTQELGHWEASSPGGGTWVVPAPQGELNSLEMVVTESGHVWSTAPLS
ncbi:MAG: hypothetical protein M3211_04530 [Actinomycetota bacterium]|nr:hypothetical protein [Actinomycetota bacterium]